MRSWSKWARPPAIEVSRLRQQPCAHPLPGILIGAASVAVTPCSGPADGVLFQRLAPLPIQAGLRGKRADPVAHHVQIVLLTERIERQPETEAIGQRDLVFYRLVG